ncbi:MAG: DNA adenine methylase [Clostridia bacterium]|nr:DNA adenine methylase [Clostridia bacterium]
MKLFKFKRFIVNDINSNIINFYVLLKSEYNYLKKHLRQIENIYNSFSEMKEKEEYYYQIREKFNKSDNKIKTVYFLFLMKAGFNGVYRENSKGKFNVPFGKKEYIRIDYDNLKHISELIQNVEFYNMDYQEFFKILKAKKIIKNAFLYCDPPYLPEDEIVNQKQLLYTKEMFDHEEFVNNMYKLTSAKYMISMTDSKIANDIYGELEKCTARELIRTINPQKSFKSTELIFSNYKINKEQK